MPDWPRSALLVGGNTVCFDFQTASDYNDKKLPLAEQNELRWGFRCVAKGEFESATAALS